ncbi:MAG: class I SAM-dependent methyltransferase [Pyrinomonadaceae bacterium]
MCNSACLDFGRTKLTEADVAGKRVIEIGAVDINGSLRPDVEALGPSEYLGIDIAEGPGVDEVCNVYDLVERYGPESFDVAISSEMIEHVHDWRKAISQIKQILRPGGVLVMTTRSIGFPYHDYPFDYWRYELDDMRTIFSDMTIEALEPDTDDPGVLVKARKPENFVENDLSEHALYSMVIGGRSKGIEFSRSDYFRLALKTNVVTRKFKGAMRRLGIAG